MMRQRQGKKAKDVFAVSELNATLKVILVLMLVKLQFGSFGHVQDKSFLFVLCVESVLGFETH